MYIPDRISYKQSFNSLNKALGKVIQVNGNSLQLQLQSGRILRHHTTDVLPCERNENNESEIDLLNMPIFGEPTFAALSIDSSNFTNPIQVIDEENVLHGNQLQQETDSDNDDNGTEDVVFELADTVSHSNNDLLHIPGRDSRRAVRNAQSSKFLHQFQF